MGSRQLQRLDGNAIGHETKTNVQSIRQSHTVQTSHDCIQSICVHADFQYDLLEEDQRPDKYF